MAIIRTDERVAIIGKTGSGKTKLAETLLAQFPNVVILDNKGRVGIDKDTREFYLAKDHYIVTTELDELPAVAKQTQHIIYRPRPELEADKRAFADEMNAFFWWIYNRENCILYIDEAASVCDSYNIPPGLNAVVKRGRELNIGCWASTQQPVNVHNTLFSEAEHFFIFRTQLQGHRDKMAGFVGDIVKKQIPGELTHSYFYFNPESMNDAELMQPINLRRY